MTIQNTGRHWLFQNGAAEWVRWGLAVLVGGAVTFGVMQSRVSVLEAQVARIERTVDRLEDNTQSGLTAIQNTIISLHNSNR